MAAQPTPHPTRRAPAPARAPSRARISVRDLVDDDLDWLIPHLDEGWGGRLQARSGELIDVATLDGLVAERRGQIAGVVLFCFGGRHAEVVFIEAFEAGGGVGSALLDSLRPLVSRCSRVWTVTTNDNLRCVRFLQRRGWRLFVVRPGAVDASRRLLKPSIPEMGHDGIPLRDELEFEWVER